MFQARFHGRGGQGVVTAAEMLSFAAFQEKKYATAFPFFGSERMGAPVMSFCRIDDREIRAREPVSEPDALIIQDPTLLQSPNLFQGLTAQGYAVINSSKPLSQLGVDLIVKRLPAGHVVAIPATEIAMEHIKRPLPNAVMLGALAALTGIVKLESINQAIGESLPSAVAAANIAAARASYDLVASPSKEKIAC